MRLNSKHLVNKDDQNSLKHILSAKGKLEMLKNSFDKNGSNQFYSKQAVEDILKEQEAEMESLDSDN